MHFPCCTVRTHVSSNMDTASIHRYNVIARIHKWRTGLKLTNSIEIDQLSVGWRWTAKDIGEAMFYSSNVCTETTVTLYGTTLFHRSVAFLVVCQLQMLIRFWIICFQFSLEWFSGCQKYMAVVESGVRKGITHGKCHSPVQMGFHQA